MLLFKTFCPTLPCTIPISKVAQQTTTPCIPVVMWPMITPSIAMAVEPKTMPCITLEARQTMTPCNPMAAWHRTMPPIAMAARQNMTRPIAKVVWQTTTPHIPMVVRPKMTPPVSMAARPKTRGDSNNVPHARRGATAMANAVAFFARMGTFVHW
jgi:hypothetical protein